MLLLFLLSLAVASAAAPLSETLRGSKPNIVILFVDDFG